MNEHKLTHQQKKFIDYYIATQNATDSAKRAGYSPRSARQTGYDNLNKPYIKAEIERRQKAILDKVESEAIATLEEALTFQSSIMRNKGVDANIRLRASESIIKAHGGYTNKIDLTGEMGVMIIDDIEDIDDDFDEEFEED